VPFNVSYALSGASATAGNGVKDAYSWSVGLLFDINLLYKVKLTYADSGNRKYPTLSSNSTNDRGRLSLNLLTNF